MEEKLLTIEKIVFGGSGLAREDQKVYFVPFTLPGEKVRAIPRRQHKDYTEADAIEIVEPSQDRIPPDCQYFGRCGGCRLSHAGYEAQLRLKLDILRETLQRSKLPVPDITVVASEPFGYRHRAKLKYSARAKLLGFFEAESHRIVDIRNCLCLTPSLNALLLRLRSTLAAFPIEKLSELECYENEKGETAVYFDAPVPLPVRNALAPAQVFSEKDSRESAFQVRFRQYEFPMRPDIFLQVNPGLWNQMMMEIESHYPNDSERTIVELYSGAGFFTLPLSQKVKKIHAVEESEAAIRHARKFSAPNVEWHSKRVEDFLFPQEATALVLDPPRQGLDKSVVERILKHPFEKITYVSCNATSFARDMRLLSEAFQIERMVLMDLFAQTHHFETIALLKAKA